MFAQLKFIYGKLSHLYFCLFKIQCSFISKTNRFCFYFVVLTLSITMNLIIDVGNSYVKIAVFKNDSLLHKDIFTLDRLVNEIKKIKLLFPKVKSAIISSVGKILNKDITAVSEMFRVVLIDVNTRLPFTNLYDTPKTLGVDRVALVCASVKQFPSNNVLIIDAGTCITFDFIDSQNNYLGGAISPGLSLRYKVLHDLTANLPLLKAKSPEKLIGSSTNESMHSGVVNGIVNEIEGAINSYKLKYPDLTVILTGGDAIFLSKQLKSSIFANHNFLLEGLNYILQFNLNE